MKKEPFCLSWSWGLPPASGEASSWELPPVAPKGDMVGDKSFAVAFPWLAAGWGEALGLPLGLGASSHPRAVQEPISSVLLLSI